MYKKGCAPRECKIAKGYQGVFNEVTAMDFRAWNVDLKARSAYHVSGFKIVIEGDPKQPMGVFPSKFPSQLTAFEQAKLLRCGMEAISAAAKASQSTDNKNTASV